MSRTEPEGAVRGPLRGAARGAARAAAAVRGVAGRTVKSTDIWMQDHYRALVLGTLLALGAGTGLLLWWRWALVIGLAKQIAPVLTIVSIIASALWSALAWFSERRRKRLDAQRHATHAQHGDSHEGS
ncbi:hypothetical protein [Streptomyces silvensis]|uniref:hypothetical protein n=1 Tax=Streptomyces silvensis TaxID=1765722 RepID=UPI000A5ACEAC|nr:hypothetical protein [Streptomyces silvensis]